MSAEYIYLASASARRRELLEQIRVPFKVHVADVDEQVLPAEAPDTYVMRVARAKADAVHHVLRGNVAVPILAADTSVVLDGEILGKPADTASALAMLGRLSGRKHEVYTGVVLVQDDKVETALSISEVTFRTIREGERRAYCATAEAFDKAGGYAIQGRGAVFVERLVGSYSSVMGLPLFETAGLLRRLGLPAWLTSS